MSINKNISLVTVNYNSTSYLKKLLASSRLISRYISEIIIVDNNSNTENRIIKKKLKKITTTNLRFYLNKKNLGFSKAVNQAIRSSKNNTILLVNPDSKFLKNSSINKMIGIINNNDKVAIVGGRILKNYKNEIQNSATGNINFMTGLFEFTNLKKYFKENPWSKKFWIELKKTTKPVEVHSCCGAFIMFKKVIDNKLNLFDENYFLYLEDLDFGLQTKKLGYKTIFCPNTKILHYGGRSNQSKYNTDLKNWYKSRKYFFRKHLPFYQAIILTIIFSLEEKILSLYHFLKNEPAY